MTPFLISNFPVPDTGDRSVIAVARGQSKRPAALARPSPLRRRRCRSRGALSARSDRRAARRGMLGAFVPRGLGGLGATIGEFAAFCEALGRACASTAMIYAMHQIEVALPGAPCALLCLSFATTWPSSRARMAHRVGNVRDWRRRRSPAQHLCRRTGRPAIRVTKRRRSSPTARRPTTSCSRRGARPTPPPPIKCSSSSAGPTCG